MLIRDLKSKLSARPRSDFRKRNLLYSIGWVDLRNSFFVSFAFYAGRRVGVGGGGGVGWLKNKNGDNLIIVALRNQESKSLFRLRRKHEYR